ncbi:MAG: nucleotide sugar dehydrogenase [Nitrososphaeraceae archaeon]|nr:nucleotide sugar dehydrogenase [Nitrososphaeraceae archaeon]
MSSDIKPINGPSMSQIAGNTSAHDIITRIKTKDVKVGVVGLGQVGLPTALTIAKVGYNVIGYDTNSSLLDELSKGITAIQEDEIKNLLVRGLSTDRIMFGSSYQSLSAADIIIVCVPTPLGRDLSADLSYLSKAVNGIASHCVNSKKLLIIESSIPPMTMSGLVVPILEKATGKKLGSGFLLAFCPERLSPGQALNGISDTVRIIGATDSESYEAAKTLYSNFTDAQLVCSSFETAEVSKLAENAYRDVNIAFANELAMVCQHYNVDVTEVIQIANTHPRVNIHNPGPGVGGPCLPKDPYLLLSKSRISASLIEKARSINDSMPRYVVDLMVRKLEIISPAKQANKLKIGILGTAYKPNVNDIQNSPTKRIILELRKRGYTEIIVHDPICKETFGMRSSDLKSLLKNCDCIILVTGHDAYASLSPNDFKPSCIIVDAARKLRKKEFIGSKRTYYTAPGLDG